MKLLKLEILNLASLDNQDGEVINFQEGALGESTIFSIVGPTGSGKSTLLDAICLALYNRAPRYPKKRGDRNQGIEIYGSPDEGENNRLPPTDCRNILTRGKKNGYSKLTFMANDGQVYRAEWHVRFLRVRYENASTLLYKITKANGQPQEEPADWDNLPQIIGLDYEQFLRTVLIAQGSFANFLNAKENERYELLEKLIGSESTYTAIAREIKAKKDAAVEAFNAINAEVDAVSKNKLSDEELALLKEEIENLEKAEQQLQDALKKIENALNWYTEDDKLQHAIIEQQTKEELAKKELEDISVNISRLKLHDALLPATDIMREIRRLEQNIIKTQTDIENRTTEINQKTTSLEKENLKKTELGAATEQARKNFNDAIPHIRKARELKTQIESSGKLLQERLLNKEQAESELKKAEKAVNNNAQAISEAQEKQKNAAQELAALQQAIDTRKQELAAKVKLAENALKAEQLKVEGLNANELQQQKNAADKAVTDIKHAADIAGKTEEAKQEKALKLTRQETLAGENADCDKLLSDLNIEALTKEVDTLRKTHTLMTSENWQLHRHDLSDGQPCPLCGATEHPFQQDSQQLEEATTGLSNLLKAKEDTLNQQTTKREELLKKKGANEGELNGIRERLTQLDKDLAFFEKQRTELLTVYTALPTTKETIEALLPTYVNQQQLASEALANFIKAQDEVLRLSKEKEKAIHEQNAYEQEANKKTEEAIRKENNAKTELERQTALTPTLVQQQDEKRQVSSTATENWQKAQKALQELQTAFKAELNGADPDEYEMHLKKTLENAEKAVIEKTNAISQLQTEIGEKNGALCTIQKQMETDLECLKLKNAGLSSWINDYNLLDSRIREITRDDVASMLNAADNWEKIRCDKEIKEKELTQATALLANSKKQQETNLSSKPEQTKEQLTTTLEELKGKSHQQELIAAKAKMANHLNAVSQLGSKAEELSLATQDKNDWQEIADAIGSDGKTLRKIAQCYTLRFLIAHANAEIRKFNSRYELMQVKNSLGIRVIDHDRADDIRDTTSLSGGETFIVSLGLALGLSSLSSCNISFENLFIDEGFGTLDPDTLAVVIDSLAMLQTSQGKKVGVISHTDTMSERITTQIRIVKNGNSGSSHIEIYP